MQIPTEPHKTLATLCDIDEIKDLYPLRKTLVEMKQPLQA